MVAGPMPTTEAEAHGRVRFRRVSGVSMVWVAVQEKLSAWRTWRLSSTRFDMSRDPIRDHLEGVSTVLLIQSLSVSFAQLFHNVISERLQHSETIRGAWRATLSTCQGFGQKAMGTHWLQRSALFFDGL